MIQVLSPLDAEQRTPSLDTVERQVLEGLPADYARLEEARKGEDFYQFRNHKHLHPRREESASDFQARPKRYSRITRTIVRKLAEPLYSNGPTRTWENDPDRTEWLDRIYTQASANSRLQSADRAATLNHVAAIQVEATGDPENPIRFWVWKGHEFAVFVRDGNPIEPWAICTIEQIPTESVGRVRTRYRVWSQLERRTYVTDEHLPDSTPSRSAQLVPEESGPTPYPGVLPFVWVRAEPADCNFWEGGIGKALVEANMEADRRQSDLAEHMSRFLNPLGFARNIPATASFTNKPGGFVHLQADPSVRSGDQGGQPELGYLQATLGVSDAWADLRAFLDSTCEELEVPLTVIRSDSSTDLSGVAIVAKAMPLIDRTRARQVQFCETERDLASLTLAVYGTWYGDDQALTAAKSGGLVVVWPEPKIPLPTPDRDMADSWELDQGLTDPIEVLARRRGITLSQAEELAEQIAARRLQWNAIMNSKGPVESAAEEKVEQKEDSETGETDGEYDDESTEAPEDGNKNDKTEDATMPKGGRYAPDEPVTD
jgi:hypothetical protein